MSLAAVILAAGASRRMGGRHPKALLAFRGETILDRLIGLYGRFAAPVIVVLGHHEAAIRQGITRGGEAELVVNPDPERGQLSSLQCGLRRAPGDVLFSPVDFPAVEERTVAALAHAFKVNVDAPMVAPSYEGKHGHPVLIRAAVKEELLRLSVDDTARSVLHRHGEAAVYFDVDDDPGVVTDIDRPEDYDRLLAREALRG